MTELWRKVWRKGVAPQLSTEQLLALKRGLEDNDARLIQRQTTSPPPLQCVADWPCEAACPIGYAALAAGDARTVGEVEAFFARVAYACDLALGEPGAMGHLVTAYDDWPRWEMRANLEEEVGRALAGRLRAAPAPAAEVA
jgi:hypothetical protein